MEVTQPPLAIALGTDNKRQCIRIKARIRLNGDYLPVQNTVPTQQHYQAYCETVSSRSQSPDIFTTPPTHSSPFQAAQISNATTYTARITPRKRAASNALPTTSSASCANQQNTPTTPSKSAGKDSKQDAASRVLGERDTMSTVQYNAVSQPATPRGSHSRASVDAMSRNHARSLSQVQQGNLSKPTAQTITTRTPVRQKRYGRMVYRPLPPLPPSPPESPVQATNGQQGCRKTTVNFSRGEIQRKPPQVQKQAAVPHLACVNAFIPAPVLRPPSHHYLHFPITTSGHERPQSKASRRTVTFADDATLSSRSSSPDHHNYRRSQHQFQPLRQSKSFSKDPQIPSSLRLYSSYESLLVGRNVNNDTINAALASRRTIPKDSKHKYTFGQRPASIIPSTPSTPYNPRLSTSKAQYRSLATLPPPLPPSVRITDPHPGPRQPPWGSLEALASQREKRVDARERDQARQLRAAPLSQATTLRDEEGAAKEVLRREVEGFKEQVMSVYPDMAFDGTAGRGGRRCCCVVM